MNKFFAAIALAALVTSPALAQSSDPSVGSGNITQQSMPDSPLSALAQQGRQPRNDLSGRTVVSDVRQENEVIDRAKGNIW